MESNPLLTRRKMLGITGMAGLAALTGIAAGTVQKRPRIACLVSYWAAPGSHADWIITKLMDGYWWQGAHTPSTGGHSICLHPSVSYKRTGSENMQIERHSDL